MHKSNTRKSTIYYNTFLPSVLGKGKESDPTDASVDTSANASVNTPPTRRPTHYRHIHRKKKHFEKPTFPNSFCYVFQLEARTSVASYADALWARHAIFLPHERLQKPGEHSFPFVQKDQPESTWRSPKSQSALGYCSIESQS